jgi:hypothetical protein
MADFKCDHCEKTFEHSTALQQHVRDKHTNPQPPEAQRPAEAHVPAKNEVKPAAKRDGIKIRMSKTVVYAILGVLVVAGGSYAAYVYIDGQPKNSVKTDQAPSTQLGALGSTHIHADLALYLDGQQITPFEPRYYVRNAYMHVEAGAGEGYVLHAHATGTPLSIFFRSLGMGFNSECFRLDNGRDYCNDGAKTLKMFVKREGGQWEENRQFHTYVFSDHDKILVTYGDETPGEIGQQQDSVTNYSRENDDRQMDLGNIPR